MNILITGASGFTGKHFNRLATSAGHRVLSLDVDLTNSSAIVAALKVCDPFDTVLHLAAISFVGHAKDVEFYAVNTIGTCNLLSALAEMPAPLKPSKVLIASSANVYGNCHQSPISETQYPAPVNHYASSKLAMEHLARTYLDSLPVVIARPFNYTGTGQSSSFLIPKLIKHFAQHAHVIELGNINVEREFNDVRMVCESYLRLLVDGKIGETYNVCSGNPYSLQTVIDQLTLLSAHKIEIKINPTLVRSNEIYRLCGDPSLLIECVGVIPTIPLRDTLSNMLLEYGRE